MDRSGAYVFIFIFMPDWLTKNKWLKHIHDMNIAPRNEEDYLDALARTSLFSGECTTLSA
jgi:hypothetical protein